MLYFRKEDDFEEATLHTLHKKFSGGHSNILSVLDLLATIPASSAEVERGFSTMKLIKTDMRSTLTNQHLNELMLIRISTPDIDTFDPSRTVQMWWDEKDRRPGVTSSKELVEVQVVARPQEPAAAATQANVVEAVAGGDIDSPQVDEAELEVMDVNNNIDTVSDNLGYDSGMEDGSNDEYSDDELFM